MQTTLDGSQIGYVCHKCGRCYDTMSDVVRHSKRVHKPKPEKITHINFTLENYCLVSTKTVVCVRK